MFTKISTTMELKKYTGRKTFPFCHMTVADIMTLRYGDHVWFLCSDGRARQLKINGKIRTWKRDPNRVEIPAKYGMYQYLTLKVVDFPKLIEEVEKVEKVG